ncbi:hypothetical protein ABKN59_007780 [Abortiporus biennis]
MTQRQGHVAQFTLLLYFSCPQPSMENNLISSAMSYNPTDPFIIETPALFEELNNIKTSPSSSTGVSTGPQHQGESGSSNVDNATILNALSELQARVGMAHRIASIAFNWQCSNGMFESFVEVPFVNGQLPATECNLPFLETVVDIMRLTDEETHSYYKGYFPGVPFPHSPNEERIEIKRAIGCTMHM